MHGPAVLRDLPLRELECFGELSQTLHFGRTAENLGVSPGRVSQMIARLESRVGGRLFVRTSRRVALSELGTALAADAVPALAQLRAAFDAAQAAALTPARPLRIGFQCAVTEPVARAVAALPPGMTELIELPWAEPFRRISRAELDVALVLAPSHEPGLRTLLEFSRHPQFVALAHTHPLAGRSRIAPAELSGIPLVGPAHSAPGYWREANAPSRLSDGTELHYVAAARTLPEALSLVITRGTGTLICEASAAYMPRPDVAYVPLDGVPDSTLLAVTRDAGTPHPLLSEFVAALRASEAPIAAATPRPDASLRAPAGA
ncbi:LysR family transcriptional regulator [Leucobacter chromiireducens]|uniref:LysR family transcriptional regulator n=1 Tax=Leucobacter chromiireducens subsp. solipictus TaxID=398235 RepID=A0ABS1SBL3_9MICO|nr:LysR family transcriptional regulator [Leucobacter chromiireducens subsp. solipictus]